jgi:hypothetical protein
MYWWDQTPEFFALYADPDTKDSLEEVSREDSLCEPSGRPLAWTQADRFRISEEAEILDPHLRAVECTQMRVDAHGSRARSNLCLRG